MRCTIGIFMLALGLTSPAIGDVTVGPNGRDISVHGTITPGDVTLFTKSLEESKGRGLIFLTLDSPGGDVYAAMTMGRLARRSAAFAAVPAYGRCDSSCVLLLVGASKRLVLGQVGLHRPYLFLEPGLPRPREAQIIAMFESVRTYFKEMNISDQVYDVMMNTPPERMIIFAMRPQGHAIHTLIPEDDPIAAEQKVAYAARGYRLDTATYRRRTLLAEHRCASDDPRAWVDCEQALLWNLDVSTYIERREIAEALCGISEEDHQEMLVFDGDLRDHPAYLALEECRYGVFSR